MSEQQKEFGEWLENTVNLAEQNNALSLQVAQLREALDMLVITKEYKDLKGKDAVYESMRVNAWKVAETALNTTPNADEWIRKSDLEFMGYDYRGIAVYRIKETK